MTLFKPPTLRDVITDFDKITVATVSTNENEMSNKNYNNQMHNYYGAQSLYWDDGKSNNSRINGLFAFVNGNSKHINKTSGEIQVHTIQSVLGHRKYNPLAIWDNYDITRTRNLLILGPIIYLGTYVELLDVIVKEKSHTYINKAGDECWMIIRQTIVYDIINIS